MKRVPSAFVEETTRLAFSYKSLFDWCILSLQEMKRVVISAYEIVH